MSIKLQKILDYEKRLLQDRQQLLELMEEQETVEPENAELVRYKLECFEKELEFMKHQAAILKRQERAETENRTEEAVIGKESARRSELSERIERVTQSYAQKVSELGKTSKSAKTSESGKVFESGKAFESREQGRGFAEKDLEKTIGKSLMGILASVLVFISLISFATLLLPYFNDTAKMITTYVISFAFLGIGIFKLRKDDKNKFFMALTGCGMGALYISLLLSNIYFHMLGDISLYVLICLWGIGVSIFARKHSKVFQIIGELGIIIAVIFGCVLCVENEDASKFLAVVIFYVISSGAFYFLHYEEEFCKNVPRHISNVISVYSLALSCFQFGGEPKSQIEVWAVFAIVVVSLGCTLWHKAQEEALSFGIFASGYYLVAAAMLDSIWGETTVFGVTIYLSAVLLIVLAECKKTLNNRGKYVLQALMIIMTIVGLSCWADWMGYGFVPMVVIPLLTAGYFRENEMLRAGGLCMALFYILDKGTTGVTGYFLMALLAVGAGFVLLFVKKERYRKYFKYGLHLVTLVLFLGAADVFYEWIENYDISGACAYLCIGIFNTVMLKLIGDKNLKTGEAEKPYLYYAVNALIMVYGLVIIGEANLTEGLGVWHFLVIVMTVITFLVNSKNLLEKRDNVFAGIYVGIKFTILLVVILNSFDSPNFLISIACLLLAIVSIVIGFRGEYKSLRIFGLVLSMISIFKLLMVDINYDNTLGNAISFFVSGILCFVISLIYNYIDNRVKKSDGR